jgi:hypothetical protein
LFSRRDVGRQAIAELLGASVTILDTESQSVRNAIAVVVLPQVQLEADDFLVEGKVAVDRYGRSRRRPFVERVLVDFRLLPERTDDARIEPAIGRAKLLSQANNGHLLTVVALERCRRAVASGAQHRVQF